MSTERPNPPAITPKVVSPRPDSPGKPHTAPPPPPPPHGPTTEVDEETVAGMERASGESKVAVARTSAVKAAAAAIAAAKTAKNKATPRRDVTSVPTDPTNEDAVPDQLTSGAPTTGALPIGASMHYSMAAVTGSSTVLDDSTQVVGAPLGTAPVASAPVTQAPPTVEPAAATAPAREDLAPRTVRLAVSKVNPWSVMKLSFLLSVGIGIMVVVAVIVFWLILDGMHVFTKADDFVKQVVGDAAEVNLLQYVEFSRVVSQTTIIAVVNVILTTALATIMAFLYNVTAALVGGLHLTLTDD